MVHGRPALPPQSPASCVRDPFLPAGSANPAAGRLLQRRAPAGEAAARGSSLQKALLLPSPGASRSHVSRTRSDSSSRRRGRSASAQRRCRASRRSGGCRAGSGAGRRSRPLRARTHGQTQRRLDVSPCASRTPWHSCRCRSSSWRGRRRQRQRQLSRRGSRSCHRRGERSSTVTVGASGLLLSASSATAAPLSSCPPQRPLLRPLCLRPPGSPVGRTARSASGARRRASGRRSAWATPGSGGLAAQVQTSRSVSHSHRGHGGQRRGLPVRWPPTSSSNNSRRRSGSPGSRHRRRWQHMRQRQRQCCVRPCSSLAAGGLQPLQPRQQPRTAQQCRRWQEQRQPRRRRQQQQRGPRMSSGCWGARAWQR